MDRKEREIAIKQAREFARDSFNSLPFETRAKLANGYDRLLELDLLLSSGESLCVATIRKRKAEVENWLLEWYREQNK